MFGLIHYVILIKCISASSGFIYDINATEYEKMPPKFLLDPYETCLNQPDAVYCYTDLTLVSDTPSALLDMIVDHSSRKLRHFNYTNVYRGVCLTRNCKKIYENANFTKTDLRTTFEGCLNETLWTKYQLKGTITNEIYCNTANNDVSIEAEDIAVAVICFTLVLVNVIGSLYDIFFTTGKSEDGIQVLLCFSLLRNWRKLMGATADGPDRRIRRLKGLIGLRTMFTCFVIAFHSLYITGYGIENTRFIEKTYDNIAGSLVYNGVIVVLIFFIISGFLFAFNLQVFSEKGSITWVSVPKGILAGLIRLTPPYAVVLALTCTWMRFVGSGPMWESIMGIEVRDCRRYWWSHILYFSNYIEESNCMLHSWYVAADFQMFCLSLILFCIFQSNRSRKIILSILFLAGVLIPAIQTYIQDLDAVLLITPEYPTNVLSDRYYNTVYRNTHTNFSCYVIGLGLGFLVYHLQNKDFNLQQYKKYTIIYWALFPANVAVVLSGSVFYTDEVQPPVLIRAAYAGLVKPVFGIFIAGIILGTIFKLEIGRESDKKGEISTHPERDQHNQREINATEKSSLPLRMDLYRGVLEWSGWASLGRVSYCAYLVHFAVVRYVLGTRTTIIHITFLGVIQTDLLILVMSYLAAFPLYLLVENPTRLLLKVLLGNKKSAVSKNDADG